MADENAKNLAIANLRHIVLDGIQFDCNVSHRSTSQGSSVRDFDSDSGYFDGSGSGASSVREGGGKMKEVDDREWYETELKKLLPCPFCGDRLRVGEDHHGWWIEHNHSASCLISFMQLYDLGDFKKWNASESI